MKFTLFFTFLLIAASATASGEEENNRFRDLMVAATATDSQKEVSDRIFKGLLKMSVETGSTIGVVSTRFSIWFNRFGKAADDAVTSQGMTDELWSSIFLEMATFLGTKTYEQALASGATHVGAQTMVREVLCGAGMKRPAIKNDGTIVAVSICVDDVGYDPVKKVLTSAVWSDNGCDYSSSSPCHVGPATTYAGENGVDVELTDYSLCPLDAHRVSYVNLDDSHKKTPVCHHNIGTPVQHTDGLMKISLIGGGVETFCPPTTSKNHCGLCGIDGVVIDHDSGIAARETKWGKLGWVPTIANWFRLSTDDPNDPRPNPTESWLTPIFGSCLTQAIEPWVSIFFEPWATRTIFGTCVANPVCQSGMKELRHDRLNTDAPLGCVSVPSWIEGEYLDADDGTFREGLFEDNRVLDMFRSDTVVRTAWTATLEKPNLTWKEDLLFTLLSYLVASLILGCFVYPRIRRHMS